MIDVCKMHDELKKAKAERDALKAEVEDLRNANLSVRVCGNHTSEIIEEGKCVICEIEELTTRNAGLVAELRRLQSAVGEVDFDIIEKLLAGE